MNDDNFDNRQAEAEPDTQELNNTPAQDTEPVPPMQPGKPMNKKSKKPLIVGGIIAAAVVVLGGGSAFAYNGWYQNPDKVLSDSMAKTMDRDSFAGDGKLVVDVKDNTSTIKLSNKILDGQMGIVADVDFAYEGTKLNLGGSAVYDKDGTIYIKVDKAAKLVDAIVDAQLAEYGDEMTAGEKAMAISMVKAMLGPIVEKIDGQWIKITPKDIDDKAKSDSEMQCVSDAFAMLTDDEAARGEVVDTYKEHRFMAPDKKLGSKDGNLGFTYTYDENIAEEFSTAVEQTKIGKKLKSCNKSSDAKTDKTSKDDSELASLTLEIWVDRWSHQLNSMKVSAVSADKEKIDFDYTPNYDEDIKIEIPTNAMTLDELSKQMDGLFEL